MCQCGCGDTAIEKAFKIHRGPTIAYQLYRGCPDCFQGIGVMLSFFNKEGAEEWAQDAPLTKVIPDENGGNQGEFNIPLFEVQDLIEASKELSPEQINKRNGYATFQAWLEDFGLQMIQGAICKARERYSEAELKETK